MPAAHPIAEILANTAKLARAFRERGLPVVLVNVAAQAPGRTDLQRPKFAFPPDWSELVPELDVSPTDFLVSKRAVGGFIGTALEAELG